MMDTQIIVIGGGLVGASFALAMGQLGFKTTVLEAHTINDAAQPSFDERSVALTLVSQRIFAGLGIWSGVADKATPIRSIHVSDRGHFGATRLHCRDAGTDALGYLIANRTLGHSLTAALDRYANVNLIAPAIVHRLQCAQESGATVDSSVGTFRADLVVIADGGRSQLTQQVGLHSEHKTYTQKALVTRVRANKPHDNRAFERFTAHGPLALLPIDAADYAVAWTLSPTDVETIQALDDSAFLSRLQHAFGARAGQFTTVAKRHVYPLSLSTLVSAVAQRAVVIGNAAHTVHPVAGQGFNLGLRDVAALANELSQLTPRDLANGASPMLARYARGRQRDTQTVSWFTDGLIKTFTQDAPALVVARNLVLSSLNLLRPVRRELLHRTMGLKASTNPLIRGQALSRATHREPVA